MTYTLKLYVPDDTQPAQRQAAERLFRQALEAALGDAAMVAPTTLTATSRPRRVSRAR